MGFKPRFAVKDRSRRATVPALRVTPRVLQPLEPDVARVASEALGNGVLALGVLRAIQASPRQEAGEICDSDAEHLLGQNVIDALIELRHLVCQSLGEAAGDLAQENSRLRARV